MTERFLIHSSDFVQYPRPGLDRMIMHLLRLNIFAVRMREIFNTELAKRQHFKLSPELFSSSKPNLEERS